VTGKKIERFARRTDFESFHGTQRLRDIMKKMGIMHGLVRKNIEPGQKIIVGKPAIGKLEY
jgi:GTP-binding protein